MKNYVANIVKQNPATNRYGMSARRPFQTFIPGVARAPGDSGRSTQPLVRRAICPGREMLLAILAPGLIAGLGLIAAGSVSAQTFTNLYSFSGGSDGANPRASLILSGNHNTLYGTASAGGSSSNGTVFGVNTDGTGFTDLHSFTATPSGTNSDGAGPYAGLVLLNNTLYGTAAGGGSSGFGTVFAVNTDGTGFTILDGLTYRNSDGASPVGGLILSGNTLYGTASGGGITGHGTVFSLSLLLPQLTIIFSGTNAVLTWPANTARGFTLQSTTNLVSSPVWTTVSPWPVFVDGQLTVTNPISGVQQFCRLSQPAIPEGCCSGPPPDPGGCYQCINCKWHASCVPRP